jgi:hypothetical protein
MSEAPAIAMATGMPPLMSNKNKIFNIGFLSDLVGWA